jgi:hypothetical protein
MVQDYEDRETQLPFWDDLGTKGLKKAELG